MAQKAVENNNTNLREYQIPAKNWKKQRIRTRIPLLIVNAMTRVVTINPRKIQVAHILVLSNMRLK